MAVGPITSPSPRRPSAATPDKPMQNYFRTVHLLVKIIFIATMSLFGIGILMCAADAIFKLNWGTRISMIPLGFVALLFGAFGLFINDAAFKFVSSRFYVDRET